MDLLSPEKRSWNMSKIRSKNTQPEMIVRSLLHSMGFRFRLHRKDLPGTPDIVLVRYSTVIFVNGCYWHRHRGCKLATTPKTNVVFWRDKFNRTLQRDQESYSLLGAAGWKILVIWDETQRLDVLSKRLRTEIVNF